MTDLTAAWTGPYGGLPPLDIATPELIEAAAHKALAEKRAEIAAIVANPEPATFANTIEAFENCGRALQRVLPLFAMFNANRATGTWPEVGQRLAALFPALDDEIAHNDALFARLEAVDMLDLAPEQKRLAQTIIERMKRRGAGLPADRRARLIEVNGEIARLAMAFDRNLAADQEKEAVMVQDEADLEGYPADLRQAATTAAEVMGRPGAWAIANTRPAVWPLLMTVGNRRLRERVWRMWVQRGDHEGPNDNKPVINALLRLRGERARLLGFDTYAHYALANRMAREPEAATALLQQVWDRVLPATVAQIAELQAIADAEGADFALMPWDRLYYAERLRQSRFGVDAEAVKAYLTLDNVLAALFHQAKHLHGLDLTEIAGVPVFHPDVRAFEVARDGEPIGVMLLDVLWREGKMRGSWQSEIRTHEAFRGTVLPLSIVCSGLTPGVDGRPVTMGWEYANVLFHEFGHALHMLMSRACYPSLGPCTVPWDFIEVPSLLNERWLFDRTLIRRYLRHHQSGEPMPEAMIDGIEAALRFDRVFSVNLDYLAPAIVDMRLHLLADGREIDAVAVEQAILAELCMPRAMDPMMTVPNASHTWSESYAAGLYVYLWADVIVADIANAFTEAPGGLYDVDIARKWREEVLSRANTRPVNDAFRAFRGREPDADALMKRFNLFFSQDDA